MLQLRIVGALGLLVSLLASCVMPPVAPHDSGTVQPPATPTSAPVQPTSTLTNRAVLVVFAASSLADAFVEIGAAFSASHPDVTVTYNFAGARALAEQLNQGAAADVFVSDRRGLMNATVENGRVVSGTAQVFVRNRLVVVFPAANAAGITSLKDLARPGLRLALATPDAPVGRASLDYLAEASATVEYSETYTPTVLANRVFIAEDSRTILEKVISGEVDAGIVYNADIAPDEVDKVGRLEIPNKLNTIVAHLIAPVGDSHLPALAQAFVDFVMGPEGQAIFARHGFMGAVVQKGAGQP